MSVAYQYQNPALSQAGLTHIAPVTHIATSPAPSRELSSFQKYAYGLLIFALCFGVLQALRCGIVSTIRLEKMLHQHQEINALHAQAQATQQLLNDKIQRYSSPFGLEEMARERLSMVGPNEVLVRIYPTAVAKK